MAKLFIILFDLIGTAEREGFEPPIPVKVCLISSQVHSTGLCHLSVVQNYNTSVSSAGDLLGESHFNGRSSFYQLRGAETFYGGHDLYSSSP
jgi:hypothetical protein